MRFGLPVAAATLGTLGLAGRGLYWAAEQSDAVSIDRQIRVARCAIETNLDALPEAELPFAVWDELVAKSRHRVDPNWFASSIGAQSGHIYLGAETYLLDPGDRPIYGTVNARPTFGFEDVRQSLTRMIDEVRGRVLPRGHLRDRLYGIGPLPQPTGSAGRDEKIIYAVHLVRVRGRAAVVSVMRVAPTSVQVPMVRGREPLLVVIRYLNRAFLDDLSRHNLIDAPRLGVNADARPGEVALRLADDDGREIGWLVWQPERPGTRLLAALGPVAVAAALALVGMMVLLVDRLRRATAIVEASEARARHEAMHDHLTGLPNRALFADRLDTACALAERGRPSALLLLDLDRFKAVNDTLGHAAGDGVLREFSRRVRSLLRASDTVARFGGDEFGIILPDIASREAVEALCRMVLAAASRPFGLPEGVARLGVSIGVALLPEAGRAGLEAMRAADRALYWAKAEGRGHFRLFDADPSRMPIVVLAAVA